MNPTGEKKVHSLVDKVYKPKNLLLAWVRVKSNRGAGGIDGQSILEFETDHEIHLERLCSELRQDSYQPSPVRQVKIPKSGKPGSYRPLGIPTVYDRVMQQALANRMEPIFEAEFDEANFGYRKGRSSKDALGKIWREIENGREWVVDADLKNFFGTVEHDKLITLINRKVSDGRVLGWIERILQAGYLSEGRLFPTERGTPQGGVISPLLSNILLTPFDKEMRSRGYRLTRYADDWVITCRTRAEAQSALARAKQVLECLGVKLNEEKTRLVHVRQGFAFLGYKIKRGSRPLRLSPQQIKSGARIGGLYAYPTEKSMERFKDRIRGSTRRCISLKTEDVIRGLAPVIRGWGQYYCKAHVRKLFNRLDRWIVRRLWSHKHKRWRCSGWKDQPTRKLYGEMGLVNLVSLIPSISTGRRTPS
ncbi:transcriptional regulator [Candidatus Nitromaritima sp. SCGC AAA799-A02]|nr:transcriptional regulator [Candidatus Nitromaritima sp. SCGC AAA799-C22]KMP10627.1 transcriptional regulator [Candidatus Nitromaritima sp. SCGC AAA799-A02]